jgi:hypothetical protein
MLKWEHVGGEGLAFVIHIYRTKVPGGWLIYSCSVVKQERTDQRITFYPDPNHEWDGNSLP